jgi:hypothetical protein
MKILMYKIDGEIVSSLQDEQALQDLPHRMRQQLTLDSFVLGERSAVLRR